jgi:hypothetical protein
LFGRFSAAMMALNLPGFFHVRVALIFLVTGGVAVASEVVAGPHCGGSRRLEQHSAVAGTGPLELD